MTVTRDIRAAAAQVPHYVKSEIVSALKSQGGRGVPHCARHYSGRDMLEIIWQDAAPAGAPRTVTIGGGRQISLLHRRATTDDFYGNGSFRG